MRTLGFGLVAGLLFVCACSSSEAPATGTAGSSGGSGAAGVGVAGSSGTGASGAGAGGSGAAGSGAGTSGSAGMAGSGGAPCGTAGSSGSAGSAGDAFTEPTLLSQTGLYSDIASDTFASDVQPFQPKYVLWSDGATKRRFIRLPACTQIDTTDMDFWKYPVGTTVWKEFTSPATGKGGAVRIETRMLRKIDDGNWFMMAFHWNADQKDAVAVPDGVMNASGTDHDIPSQNDCATCHGKMQDTLLGVTAIQLSHDSTSGVTGEVTLNSLISDGRLTAPPSGPFTLPGSATDTAALGYMHANCGHCHNERSPIFFAGVDMALWESTKKLGSLAATTAYSTTVGLMTTASNASPNTVRVVAGNAAMSVLYQRFTSADVQQHMPPLATEFLDTTGRDAIQAWINSL